MVLVTICTAHTKQKLYKLFQKYFRKTERWFQQKIIVQYQYKMYLSGTHFLRALRQPRKSTYTQTDTFQAWLCHSHLLGGDAAPSMSNSNVPYFAQVPQRQKRLILNKNWNSEQFKPFSSAGTGLHSACYSTSLCSYTAPHPQASTKVLHREADGEHVSIKMNPAGRHVSTDLSHGTWWLLLASNRRGEALWQLLWLALTGIPANVLNPGHQELIFCLEQSALLSHEWWQFWAKDRICTWSSSQSCKQSTPKGKVTPEGSTASKDFCSSSVSFSHALALLPVLPGNLKQRLKQQMGVVPTFKTTPARASRTHPTLPCSWCGVSSRGV